MASANVHLVRSIYAGWERGDFSSAEWAHPEIEFVRPDGPHPDSTVGRAGMAKNWRSFLSTWEEFRSEAYEYRELDDERVLVLVHSARAARRAGWTSVRCRRTERACSTSTAAR